MPSLCFRWYGVRKATDILIALNIAFSLHCFAKFFKSKSDERLEIYLIYLLSHLKLIISKPNIWALSFVRIELGFESNLDDVGIIDQTRNQNSIIEFRFSNKIKLYLTMFLSFLLYFLKITQASTCSGDTFPIMYNCNWTTLNELGNANAPAQISVTDGNGTTISSMLNLK